MDQWMEGNIRRLLRDSAAAQKLGTFQVETKDGGHPSIEIRRAMRSRGYRTRYEPVPTYWLFVSAPEKGITSAYSYTKVSYLKHRQQVEKAVHVTLPV